MEAVETRGEVDFEKSPNDFCVRGKINLLSVEKV
jgi:hypothetical protein